MPRQSLNLDFSQRLVIGAYQLAWVPAPAPRVWHKQFECEAPERGRATALVRYQANAGAQAHSHPLGEEILVLEGTLVDEYGEYPAGTYLRNPPGSTHTPFSETGCILFIKTGHFQPGDDQRVVMRRDEMDWIDMEGGFSMVILHQYAQEQTALVRWPPGECCPVHQRQGGEEVLILEGHLTDEHGDYPSHTWIRCPHLSEHHFSTAEGALVFIKNSHLPPL